MAYIKKIKLPGVAEAYDIYDASAIHDLSDIEGLRKDKSLGDYCSQQLVS